MVFQKVAKILADILEADLDDIMPETDFAAEYGMKTIDIAKLVMKCEKKFKITIHDEDVYSFRRLKDVAEYIEKILSERGADLSKERRESWYYE
jgi:acyl carrier protein